MTRFADRRDAGRALAGALRGYGGRADVVVLALPRGGVPVAAQVARALGAPLDVFVVRKLGMPGQPELAMGALASGGARALNPDVVAFAPPGAVEAAVEQEATEIERRERAYRGDRPPAEVAGRTVIVVDDGLATGATMRAAVEALRTRRPAAVVVAVPVGSAQAVAALREAADEVVCLATPPDFRAVGLHYADFAQTTDDEVRAALWGSA